MKKIIFSIISFGLALGLTSCQPEEQLPETSAAPITSVTARIQYKGEYLEYTGYPVEGTNMIEIEFPWYYPIDSDNLLPMSVLTEAKVTAELANNVVITEPITIMDLTQFNKITVIDQVKKAHEYIITGKLAKFDMCDILEFVIPEEKVSDSEELPSFSGLVKDNVSTVAILTDGAVGVRKAAVKVSPHATIFPDPSTEAVDFDDPTLTFTVTAHNGKSKRTYSVIKEIPPKREFGLRPKSGKVVFAKQLYAEVGIDVADKTTGLGVNGTNLIINTQGQDPVVIDRYKGNNVGTMSIGDLASSSSNYYMTSDDDGNLVFCNMSSGTNPVLTIWVSKDINTTPVQFASWNTEGATYGKKLSVQGSLNSNAVITAPYIGSGANKFARWVVSNGILVSETPEIVTINGIDVWTWNCDVCYVGDTPDSDYFVHGYSGARLFWVTGATNTVKAATDVTSVNFVANTVDAIKFNRGTYVATTQANGYGWGGADLAWLVDISSTDNFVGTLDADYNPDKVSDKSPAIFYQSAYNTYGPRAVAGLDGGKYLSATNSGTLADVILAPSTENDYYLYMYFMFCNGYVVGVQFDCLDM